MALELREERQGPPQAHESKGGQPGRARGARAALVAGLRPLGVRSRSASVCAAVQDPQCCSRKLVATFRSLFEALRASRASPRENPISMSRATWKQKHNRKPNEASPRNVPYEGFVFKTKQEP